MRSTFTFEGATARSAVGATPVLRRESSSPESGPPPHGTQAVRVNSELTRIGLQHLATRWNHDPGSGNASVTRTLHRRHTKEPLSGVVQPPRDRDRRALRRNLRERRPEGTDRGMRRPSVAHGGVQRPMRVAGQADQLDTALMPSGDQRRNEGNGMSRAHEVCLQERIGVLERDRRLEPRGAADGPPPRPGRRVRRVQRPRRRTQIRQHSRHRRPRSGGGDGQAQPVADEIGSVDADPDLIGQTRILLPENDVELMRQERTVGGPDLAMTDLHSQLRMPLRQQGQCGRGQLDDDGLERRDAQRAPDLGLRGGKLGFGLFEAGQHGLGVRDETDGVVGEAHSPANALEQRHARLPFEQRQLLRHRGRRVRQCLRDLGERAATVEFAQHPQPHDVQHGDSTH
ncbi:hypothetical protein RHCRD62_100050 [Rhodococcus sp. RD6.2]|nr:hypothetical protein RHCRD62_100050 [Rhodococcus sp. RD6.2]